MDLLWLLIIGLIAGWLASMIVGGPFGLLGDLIVGIVGSYIGSWLFSRMGWSAGGGTLGSIITATIGAIVLLLILRLFNSARWRR